MQTNRSPLLLTNLLNDLETLCNLLVDRIGCGDTLNSYLLAAGAQQIVDDYLHRDPLALRRAASIVERNRPSRSGRMNAHVLRMAGGMIWRAAVARPSDRKAALWRLDVSALVDELAMRVDGPWPGASVEPAPREAAAALTGRLAALPPGLRHELLRLPACFRSFDQAPEDMVTLANRFATRWPDRKLALTVIGVRSSGSYLAPLLASRLRRLGYADVQGTTIRPGQEWLRGEARTLRERANGSGMALLIDDPPRTWGSVTEAAGQLVNLGFEPESVVPLLPVFPDTAGPPVGLRRHPTLLLPWSEWAISRKLEPDAVERELHQLLQERFAVLDVRLACRHPDPLRRGHGGAVFDVTVGEGNEERRIVVHARGVGVGYLGEHSVAVGERLSEWLPERYGLRNGVLYEAGEEPGRGLREPLTDEQVGAVVRYVAERGRTLALDEDLGSRVFFRGVPWFAGKALSGLFGGAHELGRLICAALIRRILVVGAPALIDGQADLRRFVVSADGRTVKTDFDAGVFTSSDLFCFDPVFDLAQAAVSARDQRTADRLLREYERVTSRRVEPERWFLYQFLLINEAENECSTEPAANRLARLLQRYYAHVLLEGLTPHPSGPICTLELEGVLETSPLGFSATSPLGALVLRSLIAHGFRPVLATGRSLAALRERCETYGLAGGVAEYGAVTFERWSDRVRLLISDEEQQAFRRIRSVLAGADGVQLEPDYSWSVRAYRLQGTQQRPLDGGLAERAIRTATAHGVLRPVHGVHHTDFAAARIDFGTALRSLAADLQSGRPADIPLAFTVGSLSSDLEAPRLARAAFVVASDGAEERPAEVEVLRSPSQRGLAAATARVLGHQPGSCQVCAAPPLSSHSQLFLKLLGLQDAVGWRKAERLLQLMPSCLRQF